MFKKKNSLRQEDVCDALLCSMGCDGGFFFLIPVHSAGVDFPTKCVDFCFEGCQLPPCSVRIFSLLSILPVLGVRSTIMTRYVFPILKGGERESRHSSKVYRNLRNCG